MKCHTKNARRTGLSTGARRGKQAVNEKPGGALLIHCTHFAALKQNLLQYRHETVYPHNGNRGGDNPDEGNRRDTVFERPQI